MLMSGENNQGYIFRLIDWTIGVENIRKFREDFKDIAIEKMGRFDMWEDDIKELQKEASEAARRARDTKLDQVAFTLSLLSAFTFLLPTVPTIISILGALATLITGIRRTAVEILLYEHPYRFRMPANVKFACAWNRAMEGWTSLVVVPLGFLSVTVPQGYRIGLWLIAQRVEEDY